MSPYRTPPPFEPGPADRLLVLLCGRARPGGDLVTLPAPIRFALWVLGGMTPYRVTAEGMRRQEQKARAEIYSTSGRSVMGAPREKPAAVTAARAATHQELADEHHR